MTGTLGRMEKMAAGGIISHRVSVSSDRILGSFLIGS
jgi:hypothetical protein